MWIIILPKFLLEKNIIRIICSGNMQKSVSIVFFFKCIKTQRKFNENENNFVFVIGYSALLSPMIPIQKSCQRRLIYVYLDINGAVSHGIKSQVCLSDQKKNRRFK